VTIETATHDVSGPACPRRAGVLWLQDVTGTRYQLAVILHGGWRIASVTPSERALLEAHGFASGWER